MSFRKSIAAWMKKRFGVTLDPATEIYSLIGSKEGLGHLPLAYLNPGDVALVPDPAYPVYKNATLLRAGSRTFCRFSKRMTFCRILRVIPGAVLKKAKILFLNYPNNPVAAVASRAFWRRSWPSQKKHHLVVAYDNAYSEMYYEEPPLSFLEIPGPKRWGSNFIRFPRPTT